DVGAVRPRAGQELVAGPRHAAWRRRAPDAAVPRAGRVHGDRGRRRAGRRDRACQRRFRRRLPGLPARALPAHRPRAADRALLRRHLPRVRRHARTAQPDVPVGHRERRLRRPEMALPGRRPEDRVRLNFPPETTLDRTADDRARLYADMDPANLTPLWESLHALVPKQPRSPCVPALWRYDEVRPFLMRSGEVITAEEAV